MNLLEEIRTNFANIHHLGGMLNIEALDSVHPAWVFREDAVFGVAVKIHESQLVSEKFAGARLVTVDRVIHGEKYHLLRLECDMQSMRNEFAVVCAQMVTPGESGELRQALLANPLEWWGAWCQLLGNVVVSRNSYSVLGELLALERLEIIGEKPYWKGPSDGRVDIETSKANYEIKSTISRYNSVVNVAGQFQFAATKEKKLYLVHQRFEPTTDGDSLDIVVDRLVSNGVKKEKIELLLSRYGLEEGCSARTEMFELIQSRRYEINQKFPKLTLENFIGGVLPVGIVKIEYQIDLAGLENENF